MTAIAELERQPQAATPPPPPPPPAPVAEPAPGPFTVYFDFDRAELTPDARTELADVGLWAQWLPDGQLLHTGWWCNYDPAAPGAIGGIQDVTLQSIDGSEVRRLTNTPDIYETNVSASPTGDVAAFVPREPIRSLELVDLQSGAGETVVEGPADNLHPIYAGSWSSDGRYLQFSFGGGKGLCD